MKKIYLSFLFFIIISNFVLAQDTITVYYDEKWKEIQNKEEAVFYRKAFIDSNNVWIAHDYFKKNKIQMKGCYKSKKMEVKHGRFIYFYENGFKESEGEYKNDKKEGLWIYWHDNGVKKFEGKYISDKADGIWTFWYEKGEKKSQGLFLNDKKEGKWFYWFENGKLKLEEDYKKGYLSFIQGYYKNGELSFKGNIEDNKEQGQWFFMNSSGRVVFKGNYSKGKKTGIWIRTFKDSEMYINYSDGEMVKKDFGRIIRRN